MSKRAEAQADLAGSLTTTRAAYDLVAALYSDRFRHAHETQLLDRSLLSVFADLIQATGGGPVADLGCGPGHVTAFLQQLGLDISGLDLSPAMIALAQADYPRLRFSTGSILELPMADAQLAGILAWYSLIHLPPQELPGAIAEFARALRPGGIILLGFFGTESAAIPVQPFDHAVAPAYRLSVDQVSELLAAQGLMEIARMIREPGPQERFQHARVIATKPQ